MLLLSELANEGTVVACGIPLLLLIVAIIATIGIWRIARALEAIAGRTPRPGFPPPLPDAESRPHVPEDPVGVPAGDYGHQHGLSEKSVVDDIKAGRLKGFVRKDEWFVEI